MPCAADIAAERLLSDLAELSLGVAQDVAAAVHDTHDPARLVALAEAYAKVARCVRMSVALAARFARGAPVAPARQAPEAGERREADPDETVLDEERAEGEERENLYDRLPSGPLPDQVAAVARTLAGAAAILPAETAGAHVARCDALVAGARRILPLRPAQDITRFDTPDGHWRGRAPATAPRTRGPPGPLAGGHGPRGPRQDGG